MYRLDFVLRRRAELSREKFQAYWRETHGPLVSSFQRELRLVRYVQTHTSDDPLGAGIREQRPGMQEPFDGYASVWWATREDLDAALQSPEGQKAVEVLIADEARFIDLERSALWLAVEVPQINPPADRAVVALPQGPLAKVVFLLNAKPGLGDAEAQRYWMTNHAYVARTYAAAMGFNRYLQSHRLDDPLNAEIRASRNAAEAYLGIAEVWADRVGLQSLFAAPEAAGMRGFALLAEDEPRFMDLTRSSAWIATERVFIDQR